MPLKKKRKDYNHKEFAVGTYYGNPVFKNEADAQYVIDNPNFRDILDIIFKL